LNQLPEEGSSYLTQILPHLWFSIIVECLKVNKQILTYLLTYSVVQDII
jgi:hypothetical protein